MTSRLPYISPPLAPPLHHDLIKFFEYLSHREEAQFIFHVLLPHHIQIWYNQRALEV